MSAPTYEIRRVADFLAVPQERRAACLLEFAVALDLADAIVGLIDAIADDMGVGEQVRWKAMPCFTWIDDGRRNATIRLHAPEATS